MEHLDDHFLYTKSEMDLESSCIQSSIMCMMETLFLCNMLFSRSKYSLKDFLKLLAYNGFFQPLHQYITLMNLRRNHIVVLPVQQDISCLIWQNEPTYLDSTWFQLSNKVGTYLNHYNFYHIPIIIKSFDDTQFRFLNVHIYTLLRPFLGILAHHIIFKDGRNFDINDCKLNEPSNIWIDNAMGIHQNGILPSIDAHTLKIFSIYSCKKPTYHNQSKSSIFDKNKAHLLSFSMNTHHNDIFLYIYDHIIEFFDNFFHKVEPSSHNKSEV